MTKVHFFSKRLGLLGGSLLLALHFYPVFAQSLSEIKGTPRIIHYSRKDFNGDPQIWAMTQDKQGIMYFGNNDGTLIFDGARWHKVVLPNNSSVRSMLCSSNGTVYAGGYNELGEIVRSENGQYHYKSLIGLLPENERNLENFWGIHEVQGYIVFRSFTKLVAINGNKALTIPTPHYFYSNTIRDQLYLADAEGIKTLDLATLEFTQVVKATDYAGETIASILEGTSANELLIFTKQGSSYRYQVSTGEVTSFKKHFAANSNNQVLNAIKSTGGNYFLGTLSSQIIVLSKSGDAVQVDEAFLKLQDNTVLNLFESNEGNIWALLNNGIDCINISSPVSVMFEDASVFDVLIHAGKIYAATNQGVLVSEKINQNPHFSSLAFTKVPGLEGQTWTLQNFQDKVICSHDRGVFILSGEEVTRIENLSGVWKVIPIEGMPYKYLACTYNGIAVLEFSNNTFKVLNRIEGFNESSRDIIQDKDGIFWVCHGYKGVFRIRIDKQFERIVSLEHFRENGLPSPYSVNVFEWKNQVVFTTNNGLFTFNSTSGNFEPLPALNNILGTDRNIRKLLQYGRNTWFVQDDELGYFEDTNPELHKGLFLEIKGTFNRGMECILPVNETNVLVGTNTGLFAYDLSFDTRLDSGKTLINQVSYLQSGEKVYSSLITSGRLPYEVTDIHFEFSSPRLKDQTRVQYSYFLEGLDDRWSDWTEAPQKDYAQLYPGRYTFRVKARSMLGELAPEARYSFIILPVWYLTNWAIALYLVVLVSALYASRKLVKRKIKKEKNKTRHEEEKKQRVLELEIERMKLEREKELISRDKEILEEDVIYKSKELANYTMLLVKKRELLTDLRDELKDLKELAKNEKSRNKLRELTRKIGIHLNDEEHIHVFEANFERVHHEFFAEMKAHFPDLTSKELRLCALVRMNLTNKEIAPILNISIRGVETARYRLRKRLSLGHDENTVDFLEKLSPASQPPPPEAEEEEQGMGE